MSQRARAYRRQARSDRYGAGSVAYRPTPRPTRHGQVDMVENGEWNRCPHCGTAGLDMMATEREFREVARLHGSPIGTLPANLAAATVAGYWFCHRCAEGGAFGLSDPPPPLS